MQIKKNLKFVLSFKIREFSKIFKIRKTCIVDHVTLNPLKIDLDTDLLS